MEYTQYLNLPTTAVIILAAVLLIMQIVGKFLEFKGKVAPEIMNLYGFFKRKSRERKDSRDAIALMPEIKKTLEEINAHYNTDNISKRNGWITSVNQSLADINVWKEDMGKKLDKTNSVALSILIENKRSEIIGFASYVIDENKPVTHEQFNRIFKMYADYERILEENEMTNGEATTAMRIIREAYENHMRNHTFIEDIRGYDFIY